MKIDQVEISVAETTREKVVKARALMDAHEYISLMRQISPESLELTSSDDEVIINLKHSQPLFNDALSFLHASPKEMALYTTCLAQVVKNILSK